MTMTLKTYGLQELKDDLEAAVKAYPDLAEKALRKSGNRFKGHVRILAQEKVKTDNNLTKGFSVSGVKNTYTDMRVEFSAEGKKNPHWHLVEDGHDIIMPYTRNGVKRKDAGEYRGYVPGIKVLPQAVKNYPRQLEADLLEMTDELLRKTGLG